MTLALLLALIGQAGALPENAFGPEFQVNTDTTGDQDHPAVGPDGAGGFVVVWQSFGSGGTDTDRLSIQGQRHDSTGTPVGGQFQINTYTTSDQDHPAVSPDGAGGFVVVWQSVGSGGTDTDRLSIQGQRYDSTGSSVGGQFQINTYTGGVQSEPAVSYAGAGGFVVLWESVASPTDDFRFSVQGQRYDSTGSPVGGEFQVNTYTDGDQREPAVSPDGAGGILAVWWSRGVGQRPLYGIQGQRYDSSGTPVGGEFQVNTYTSGSKGSPAVSPDGAGGFVVVWESFGGSGTDTSGPSIQGRQFDGTGTPVGGEFQVNTFTTGYQREPAMGPDGAGGFVVVWQSAGGGGTDTSSDSIQGQRYDGTATPVGGEFQVNTYTTGDQSRPAVSLDGAGGFVVVWGSDGSSGTDAGDNSVQGQRYDTSEAATTTSVQSTTTTTTTPPCVTASACDDANLCTDDACVGGQCRQTDNTAPCEDGSVCTTGDVCGSGACMPGVPLDVSAVAGFVTGAVEPPAACTADKTDRKRVRKVLKQLKAARKKLLNAAQATTDGKRDTQIEKADAKLAKASDRLGKLALQLSPPCLAAMVDRIGQARAQAGCL